MSGTAIPVIVILTWRQVLRSLSLSLSLSLIGVAQPQQKSRRASSDLTEDSESEPHDVYTSGSEMGDHYVYLRNVPILPLMTYLTSQ